MASFKSSPSSSSVAATRWRYDVFLSFRGEDTRNNFVDHLYTTLVQRGIHVFKDDKELQKGKSISHELLKAIEESRFSVIVFSKSYADSSWCLDELVKIMECEDRIGQVVLPVFYHLTPSDVRGQKRDFDTAFQQHDDKFKEEMDKVKDWRKALAAAASLSGWHVSESGNRMEQALEGESAIITEIVEEIVNRIQPHGMVKNLIGIKSRVDELYLLLDMEAVEEVRMVGIFGMGGIGKTTIAHALFRLIAHKFECSSFVEDVRENSSSKKDIYALQKKILRDMKCHHKQKILLVLDDVDDVKQLEFLAATPEFGPGSRIIITTRDEHLLSNANAKYKPDFLPMNEAIELFCRHAFQKSSPLEGYEELAYRAIHYASCLPLALKVLGSFFHGRQIGVWESALDRLAEASDDKIFETLKLSFYGLNSFEKQIFLDIACFYKGKDEEHVTRVLDSFGFHPVIGISVLIEKSLITISNKRVDMHDLIQEMGWKIVRESFPNSRLWQPEQVHDFFKGKKQNPKAIEAIMLMDYDAKLGISADVFARIKNLRLLDINGKFTSTQPPYFPDELRWLCWNKYPFKFLPLTDMCKLVGLDVVGGNIKRLWKGLKILPNLKFVHLENLCNLTSFPDVSGAPNIERLILSDCRGLVEVHESLGAHRRLIYLDINDCYQLKCLPSRFEMESLETLIISRCFKLERFPEVSPCMVKLSQIHISSCKRIKELPSSIEYLSSLSFLSLTNCSNLHNIPDSICELKYLKCLHLNDCMKLEFVPEKLGSMKILEELWLGLTNSAREDMKKAEDCELPYFGWLGKNSVRFHSFIGLSSLRKLDLSYRQIEEESFPENLDAFSSLEELYLSGNSQLVQLPPSISHLVSLKCLELNNCSRLESLCALPSSIQVLKANYCLSLKKIGDLSKESEWLYKIWLSHCQRLLEDEENQQYLANMLQQSFIKKCAAVNHRLSIAVPGSKIPSWVKEEKHGCRISIELPHKWHTQIMGFVVCAVFRRMGPYAFPRIIFKISSVGKVTLQSEIHRMDKKEYCMKDATEKAEYTSNNVWISYMPVGFFQKMYNDLQPEDWSHIEGNLHMTVTLTNGTQSLRCGAHVIFKEDVQRTTTCMSDFGNVMHVDDEDPRYDEIISGNTCVVYEEKSNEKSLMPLGSRISKRRSTKEIHAVFKKYIEGKRNDVPFKELFVFSFSLFIVISYLFK
ncbi:hypothetical protein Lser_V15G06549 [Lactuca serriola]